MISSKTILKSLLGFHLIIFLCTGQGCSTSDKNRLRIAVAANSQFAIEEVAKGFEEYAGVECDLIVGSSGKLTAQIKSGAPYHVFIAANTKYPKVLYESGLTEEPPKVYAFGELVLWSNRKEPKLSLDLLLDKAIKHIAIANPKTAPYGQAAFETLNHFNLTDKINHKLIYGESISQVNQFISTGSVKLGFTAKSTILSPKLKDRGRWIAIDPASYERITQSAVIIDSNHELAKKFFQYLFSPPSQAIFKKYGYAIPE